MIGVGALVILGGIGVALNMNDVTYVADVSGEVSAITAELVDANEQLKSGTMSPSEATAVKARISSHIEKINSAIVQAKGQSLSGEALSSLYASLTEFNRTLMAYQDSLAKIDTLARTDSKSRGSSSSKPLAAQFVDIAEVIETHIEDASDDEELTNVIEEEVSEQEDLTTDETLDESEDTEGTTTDEVVSDTDTTIIDSDSEEATSPEATPEDQNTDETLEVQ